MLGMHWIYLAQDGSKWWDLLKTGMTFWVQ
jgi:hypothetical protein